MDEQTKEKLWDELKLIQPIIDKFDGFTFQIKNWFITTFVALSGFAIAQKKGELLFLNLFLIVAFYFYEVTYRAAHGFFLARSRTIQGILRTQRFDLADLGPHLDMYAITDDTVTDSWVFGVSRALGIPEERAAQSAKAAKDIFPELRNMLVQPRVSFIYLFAFVANFFISLSLDNWRLIAIYALVLGLGIWAYITGRARN